MEAFKYVSIRSVPAGWYLQRCKTLNQLIQSLFHGEFFPQKDVFRKMEVTAKVERRAITSC